MELPSINLNDYKNDDGYYKESVAKALETIYGKPIGELEKQAQENAKPDVPEGDPAKWPRDVKLKFIRENKEQGNPNAYKQALNDYRNK